MNLSELYTDYLFCRTYGHSWDTFTPLHRRPKVFKYFTALRCTRCTTERFDYEGALGQIVGREYIYPEGYHLASRVTRSEFRLEFRRRRRAARKTG